MPNSVFNDAKKRIIKFVYGDPKENIKCFDNLVSCLEELGHKAELLTVDLAVMKKRFYEEEKKTWLLAEKEAETEGMVSLPARRPMSAKPRLTLRGK